MPLFLLNLNSEVVKSIPWIVCVWLVVVLSSCKNDDDATEPVVDADLIFEPLLVLEGTALNQATGFIASEEENALYFAHRETNPTTRFSSEKIIRFDLETQEVKFRYFDREDFITKRMHLLDDSLYVIGGSFVNIYPLDLERPKNIVHGLQITRFGSAVYQNEVYIWGGDIEETNSDKVYRWNKQTEVFDEIGQLPTAKTWALGEIIGGKLFIFGGRREFTDERGENVVFIHDLSSNTTVTSQLPQPVARTFTSLHRSSIFLSGQTIDADPSSEDLDIYFGVFNPSLLTFFELRPSLSDEGWNSITAMTIMNSQIYVLYGNANSFFDNAPMTVMVADIPTLGTN